MTTTMPAGGAAAPGFTPPAFLGNILGTVDYVSRSAGRVLEGVYDYKLLKSELEARNAASKWQAANAEWLNAQRIGSSGSDWSTQGPQDQIVAGGAGDTGGTLHAGFGNLPSWVAPLAAGTAIAALIFSTR